MTNEQFAGTIVGLVSYWGSAALFYGIGVWASRSKNPVNFWAGTKLDPQRVSDVTAYNHENAVMWKIYSVPLWLAGALSIFDFVSQAFAIAGLALAGLACFPGLVILIRHYRKIENKYID